MSTEMPLTSANPSSGPFYTAIASVIVPVIQLAALLLGMRVNMMTVLSIIVPAATLSTLLVAVSLAWMFLLIGRLHRQPAKVIATSILLIVSLIVLFVIIIIIGQKPVVMSGS